MGNNLVKKTLLRAITLFLVGIFISSCASDDKSDNPAVISDNAIERWQKYELDVRDSKIPVEEAAALLPEIMQGLDIFAQRYNFNKAEKWIFPVEGYSTADIGGSHGEGFQPDIYYGASAIKGYSFFDGNRHGGHPAHDIFIHDRNQDCLDDRTQKPVYVVAMMDGIVISTFKEWRAGSKIRGGNYIWCYHPQENLVSYYAHLKDITVEPGQKVTAGAGLGTIGRTGFSAEPKRSPTHLHLMVLEYKNKDFSPHNYFKELVQNPLTFERQIRRHPNTETANIRTVNPATFEHRIR